MKSEFIPKQQTEEKSQFPFLAEWKKEFIVLFTAMNEGIVVYCSRGVYKIGYSAKAWDFNTMSHNWRVLEKDEKVVLSN